MIFGHDKFLLWVEWLGNEASVFTRLHEAVHCLMVPLYRAPRQIDVVWIFPHYINDLPIYDLIFGHDKLLLWVE
jgi:hypothetical protein